MHVLGTRVPRRLGVARSASSPKAALALGCSLTPGLRISFGRVTCMARAASVPGLWALGFLLLACVCGWVRVAVGCGLCSPLPVVAGVLGGCAGPGSRLCPALLGWVVGVCFLRFFFFFCCWLSLSRASCSLPPSPFFPARLLAFFFFCGVCLLVSVPLFPVGRCSWLVVAGFGRLVPLFLFGGPVFGALWVGGLSPFVLWAGGLVAVGCFAAPPFPPPPLFFFFFFWWGRPGCSSLCLPSAGARSVAGGWCGWSLATPGGGSCVLLPATPGWVSLPVLVGGPRHSWLGSAGGGGVWRWCVGGVVAGVWCGWSLATPGGGSCVLLPATPGWVSLPVVVGGPRHSGLGSAGGVGVWCAVCGGRVLVGLWLVCGVVGPSPLLAEVPVCYSPPLLAGFRCRCWWAVPATPGWGPLAALVCGVWRWCVGGVVAGVWCGWSLATPGGGSCVLLPATPGWVSLPVVVGGPRHSWLGSAGGVGVWCVVCGGGVLVGLWLVCGVVGPSPLLAEVPVCYSPPLLAGFRCRCWWAVPATPGWGPLAALVCGVWCVAVVCWWGWGVCVVWLVPRHSWRRFLCATPRHSWLGFAAGVGGRSPPLLAGVRWRRWCVVCGVWRWCVAGVGACVWCGWSLATPGGGSCVLLPATPGWVSLPVVVGSPRHSWLGSAGGVGVWCAVCGGGVLVGLWLVCGVVGPSPLLAEVPVCYSPPLLAGFRCRCWWAVPATPGWGPLAALVRGVWRWCVAGVVVGVWCGGSLATPGRGSCVLLPATPGWVSLPVLVGGPRHSWLGSAGGGGVWCVVPWPGRAGRPPGRVLVRLTFSFGRFVFLLCLAPSGLGLPPSLSLLLPLFWLPFFFFLFRPPAASLSVRSHLVCVFRLAVGCSLVVAPPAPSPFVSRGLRRSCLVPWSFFFFFFFFLLLLPLCAPVVSGFLWFPAPGALGLGACVFCFVGLPLLGSPCACPSFVLSAWLLAALWWLPPPPPPSFVSRGFRRCRSVLCAVLCCASLGAVLRVLSPGVVLSCAVLRSFGAAACCLVLCGAVFCGVPPRCVCFVVARWCVLCVSWGVVLCVPCALRSVRCCASLCWCARVVLFVWCVLLLAPGAVVRCCVLCCFLWCAVVRCWVWWPVVVSWWRFSVSVSLSGRVVCFPVVGVVCCGALLSCVVFCCAVLSRGAVLLCSAVVLRCCWGLLCPPVGCRAVLCCFVGWLCCFLPGGGVCVLWCSFPRAVRSLSSPLCALRCLVVLAVVPCFPVSCAVALCCRVVLCCRALLSFCGAVCVSFALLRPVVRRQCGLRCCWCLCLVLWRVPVRCGVSLGVLRCGGAALVCRGVLLCCALSCGVLRPVPCPAVPCCPAVLCWLAVLCGCLRCWCLFFFLASFPLLKTPAIFPCL